MSSGPQKPSLVLAPKLLTLASIIGCASVRPPTPVPAALPLKISMLPPEVDVEKLVPPVAALEPIEAGTQFRTIPINGGRYCESGEGGRQDCVNLLAGFVVSEMVYAEAIRAKSEAGRLTVENRALRKLRSTERAAIAQGEQAYQQRIVGLEREVVELRRPKLWDSLRFPVAFVFGAAVTSLAVYGATR